MKKRKEKSTPKNPIVLIVNVLGREFGGQEIHVFSLYKELCTRERNPLLLVLANSPLHQRIIEAGLNCYTIPYFRLPGFYRLLSFILPAFLAWLCKRHDIQVIHCNNRFEIRSALLIAKIFHIKVIFNYHVTGQFETKILRGIHAFIAPSPDIVRYVKERNLTENLGIRQLRVMTPLFDTSNFVEFCSRVEADNWFGSTFGITIKRCPVICTIGNMFPDLLHKNYPLLLKAMSLLIHNKKILVQAVLVGDGPVRPLLERLAKSLDVQDYVYFVGFTNKHTAGALYHSDIFVLPSSREAFGIVFLEAGLMHKPAIGSRGTGAEVIIVHEKTGLLFENGSADSLADAIQFLVKNPVLAGQYGDEAYERVMTYFAPPVVVLLYEALYETLLEA